MKANRYLNRVALTIAAVSLAAVVFVIGVNNELGVDRVFTSDVEEVELPEELNVFIIGLDARRGSDTVHCDAIHAVQFNLVEDTVEFVNVPRGTFSYIEKPEDWESEDLPTKEQYVEWTRNKLAREAQEAREGGDDVTEVEADVVAEEFPEVLEIMVLPEEELEESLSVFAWEREMYLANVCDYIDINTFIERVERVTGLDADYTVFIGFSQAQGLLRALALDPVATLQFLRHRQTYVEGDRQRSYNQSVFLQDLLVERVGDVERLPTYVRFALYRFVDTDMPFPVAEALLEHVAHSNINGDASAVSHRTAPSQAQSVSLTHLDIEHAKEQVEALNETLKRYKGDFEVDDVQGELISFIGERLYVAHNAETSDEALVALEPIVDQQLWHQVEDGSVRARVMLSVAKLDSQARAVMGDDLDTVAESIVLTLTVEEQYHPYIDAIESHLRSLDSQNQDFDSSQ